MKTHEARYACDGFLIYKLKHIQCRTQITKKPPSASRHAGTCNFFICLPLVRPQLAHFLAACAATMSVTSLNCLASPYLEASPNCTRRYIWASPYCSIRYIWASPYCSIRGFAQCTFAVVVDPFDDTFYMEKSTASCYCINRGLLSSLHL